MFPRRNILAALCVLALAAVRTLAQTSAPATRAGSEKWEPDIRKFEASDAKSMPASGGLLFVGSSTIRFWKTSEAFSEFGNVINRGFGGSEMIDSATFAPRIILPYKPKVVVVYAGDNDLAAGTTPEQVDDSFHTLLHEVHGALPETKLVILSAKVSHARLKIRDKTEALNKLFQADAAASGGWVTYVDIVPLLLDEQGQPIRKLFRIDGLHMSDAGYAKVNEKLRPVLAELMK
jgi:lysophospholipase L1-like esterase